MTPAVDAGSDDGTSLLAFRTAVLSMVQSEKTADLTLRQLAVLMALSGSREPETVRGMAQRLNVHKPAVTRAMDRLEQHGLAERRPDPIDRRSVWLSCTRTGEKLVKQLGRAMRPKRLATCG